MIPIFLDTNVLMHADRLHTNIEDAIDNLVGKSVEVLIHPLVEAEIINSLLEKGKKGNLAKFAMKIMSLFTPYLDDRDYSGADTALMLSAKRENGIVFTLDLPLKKRCLAQGIPVISSFIKGKLKLYGFDYSSSRI